tara:strand:- start:10714 stop:11346 length:633 start_codon:yes stop_codon:yes gene_type:complete
MTQLDLQNEIQRNQKIKQYVFGFSNAIRHVVSGVDNSTAFSESVAQIIETYNNGNKIVTTGMGKAGKVMQKFSATLCSLNIPSCFLHPGEASHGDLGIIDMADTLFVASTSGKTREVIETIELSDKIGINCIIGITSHVDSIVRKKADITIDMGEIVEAGDLKLAPTTSTIVMSAVTDALALVASEEIGLTKERFGHLHHGGYLGAKANE